MTIETASSIRELDPYLPDAYDWIKEGDDHIRLIKKVLKKAFGMVDVPWSGGTITGDTTLEASDTMKFFLVTGNGITITLPRGVDVPIGTMYIIKAVGGPVTVKAPTNELIDGKEEVVIPHKSWAIFAKISTSVWTYVVASDVNGQDQLMQLITFGYDGNKDYAVGDVVYWNGKLYWATQASSSTNQHPPSDGAYWTTQLPAGAGGASSIQRAGPGDVNAGTSSTLVVTPYSLSGFVQYSTADPGAGGSLPVGHLFCVYE